MYNRLDDNTAKRLVELDINNYKIAATLCDSVIDLVKQFDGKVFNVKFEKKLEEQTNKRFSIKKDNIVNDDDALTFRVEWFVDNEYINTENHNTYYTDNRYIVLCGIYNRENVNNPIENKRIIAKNIIPNIEKRKTELMEKVQLLEESLKKVDSWKKEIEEIREHCKKISKEIPSEIKEYYKIGLGYTGL